MQRNGSNTFGKAFYARLFYLLDYVTRQSEKLEFQKKKKKKTEKKEEKRIFLILLGKCSFLVTSKITKKFMIFKH